MSLATIIKSGMLVFSMLFGCGLAACASDSPYRPENKDDDFCVAGETLLCEERVNDVTRCVCSSRDALKELLEPDRPRLK